MLFEILAATFVISAISLVGVVTLLLRKSVLEKATLLLVALSAGALMGGAFLHLLPEAMEGMAPERAFIWALFGFVIFYVVEKALHWRHCHKGCCDIHTFSYMSLIGDAIHNFIDGLAIAASFVAGAQLGIATTIAVASHEIPQELGDFAVLIHGGMKSSRAVAMNFITALTAMLGGIVGFLISTQAEGLIVALLPIAAGGFIYVSASDLMPEIRKTEKLKDSVLTFAMFLAGLGIMYLTKLYFA